MYMVAVSYLEWIRWIATGWFRCVDRVVWVDGAEDQSGIDALLDRTPDLQVSDDQGYVIACLHSDSLISSRVAGRGRSVAHLWLSVAAVSSFHPLSIRGARLLEADAERAAVRLSEPLFEKAWADWRDRRLEDEAHWRGLSLCAAFGLDKPVLNETSNQVDDILAGRKAAPNAAKARDRGFEGSRALGWSSAMTVATSDSAVKDSFSKTPEKEEITAVIKSLSTDYDISRPLLNDETTVRLVRGIDVVLRKFGAQFLPLELMATVMHYRSLATGERQITLDALVDDLVAIALEDPDNASLAAYFIGRSMENVAVTTLLYQSEPARYNALDPVAGQTQLNVIRLAAIALERRQSVNEVEKANSDGEADANTAEKNVDATSGAAAGGEQPVGDDKQAVVDGPNLSPVESSDAGLTKASPDGVDKNSTQRKNSSTELQQGQLFSEAKDGGAPKADPTEDQKTQRQRRKS